MQETNIRTAMADASGRTVLVVDDMPENLAVISQLLQPAYRVQAARSGRAALRIVQAQPRPDLILLDVMMPEMDGYAVLERLRADVGTRHIPVIFITALGADEDEELGLRLGAVDYLTKPIKPSVLLARVGTHIELKQARDFLMGRNASLETEIESRMAENDLIQLVSIRALAHLAETRDPETGNHILRTQAYVQTLANHLRGNDRFGRLLTERYIDLLALSAPLHDIGKVGIPDAILLKPGKLDPDEWAIMQTHASIGADAIELAERDAEQEVAFLKLAKEIARWHHEKWDGSGYPDGLAGDAIPLSARLMALADVFDALISQRVYKPAMPYARARAIIVEGRGRHFDPDLVDAFTDHFEDFVAIAERYRDGG
jgi:putative two-component system response regulator